MHAFGILLLISTIVVLANTQTDSINPILKSRGIYYEPLGYLNDNEDEWKSVAEINLDCVTHNADDMNEQIRQINRECSDDTTECQLQLTRSRYLLLEDSVPVEESPKPTTNTPVDVPILVNNRISEQIQYLNKLWEETDIEFETAAQNARQRFELSSRDFFSFAQT